MRNLHYLLPLVILFSCTVQKRKYQKGFYVSTNKSKVLTKKDNTLAFKKDLKPESIVLKPGALNAEFDKDLETSVSEKIISVKKSSNYSLINFTNDEPCDKITFKNGDEISVKILEIAPYDIKYKKCDLPDGPSYIIKKSTVFMITYANGTKEVFKEPEVKPSTNNDTNSNNKSNNNDEPTISEATVISLVTGITGFLIFFGSIPAIIFGAVAIKKINREPKKYTGKGMAIGGLLLGILGVVLKILLIALILSL